MLDLTSLKEGMDLPGLSKQVAQANINLYAEASKDFNPVHLNEEFARKNGMEGTIAHGMLILAYISEMMTASFGKSWITTGKLDVRFKAPARPGETINVSGKVIKMENKDGQNLIRCSVLCANSKGEQVITGEASLITPV